MRLTSREHWLGAFLAIFVMLWALFALGVRPALERIETLSRVIPEKQSELERLRTEVAEYVALHDGLRGLRSKIASQEETFELLPFVDSLVQECGLTQHVVTMKPQTSQFGSSYRETVVEIKMESLTLRQLLDFLLKLESSKFLANTKRLYIEKNLTDASLLDSQVEISNLKLSQS